MLLEAAVPTTVTTKGQVTIPKGVRDLLGIKPGNSVTFEVAVDGSVTLRKERSRLPTARPQSRFARLRGRATAGSSTEETMALRRARGSCSAAPAGIAASNCRRRLRSSRMHGG